MRRILKTFLAIALVASMLSAGADPFGPALTEVQSVGSNPRANRMTEAEFASYTAGLRTRHNRFFARFSPDYRGSAEMLGPPREGRLRTPLPLARSGQAQATIIADFSPRRHTPEATLGRADYPPEVAVMRHTGHIVVRNAVNELKHWLDTLTGADFPVHSDAQGVRTRIFVGADFARPHFAADLTRLGEGEALDGFAVRTRGRDIYIFGATAKGTLNGVYAFIENNSDLIWAHSYSDLGTVYTVNPDLDAVWGDGLEIPGTIQRGWLGHYSERDGKPAPLWMWQMRNRNNFVVAPGPSPRKAEWGCWREAGGHMLGTFLPNPAKPYFPWIPDPETGQLRQPERIEHYHHNICMTHPDLPAAYARKVVDAFRSQRQRDPNAPLGAMRLGVEDPGPQRNYGLCRCERCLRPIRLSGGEKETSTLPDWYVTSLRPRAPRPLTEIPVQHAVREGLTFRSAQFYLLLESIARALAAEFPDARLSTYAYYLHRTYREGAPSMARFFSPLHEFWYARHRRAEDFVQLGWIIEQSGQRDAMYRHLTDAMNQARHPMARANIARLLTTFDTWFHLNLEAGTANEMLVNAKLGRHVPFSSFLHGDRPLPVTYVTFQRNAPQASERLFGADDARLPDFTHWTFRLRIRPVGPAADDAFPVPLLSLGSLPAGGAAAGAPAPWTLPVAAVAQPDGSFLYTARISRIAGSAFNPAAFRVFRLEYPPGQWRVAGRYRPEFAVFDPQLTDPNGRSFVDGTLPQRQGDAPRRRWR